MEQLASAKSILDVPPSYQDVLKPRRLILNWREAASHVLSLAVIYLSWSQIKNHQRISVMLVMLAVPAVFSFWVALMIWKSQAAHPWQYRLTENGLDVIQWFHHERTWQWHTLTWERESIYPVEATEWRGWPALRLKTAAKRPVESRTAWADAGGACKSLFRVGAKP